MEGVKRFLKCFRITFPLLPKKLSNEENYNTVIGSQTYSLLSVERKQPLPRVFVRKKKGLDGNCSEWKTGTYNMHMGRHKEQELGENIHPSFTSSC
jgi:hypothetical protein